MLVRALLHLAGMVWRLLDVLVLSTRPRLLRADLEILRARVQDSPYVWPRAYHDVQSVRMSGQTLDELVYGEIPVFAGVILLWLAGVRCGACVLDVGAGRGRLLLAALRLGADARGVEIVTSHVIAAARILARAGATLDQGDGLFADLEGVDCAYVSWTGFSEPTRARLAEHLANLRSGAAVIVVTHPIDHPAFEPQRTLTMPFTWGPDTARIYVRR